MKFTPSATLHKKYKNYSTYKGKIIMVDNSKISSIVLETPHPDREAAVAEAKREIEKMIRPEYVEKEER